MVSESHLCVRVVYTVIHQHHDEDGNRYAEITDDPAKLKSTGCENFMCYMREQSICSHSEHDFVLGLVRLLGHLIRYRPLVVGG